MNQNVTFIGYDDWKRKLFKTEDGTILVDVDGVLHTINDPDGWAEPCCPTEIKTPKDMP